MSSSEVETILVVCADPERAARIVGRLYDEGVNVVGPASTAGVALALAAQTAPRSAVLAGPTGGRRNAEALAGELDATWGVECFVLPSPEDARDCPQAAVEARTAKLRRLLGGLPLRRADLARRS